MKILGLLLVWAVIGNTYSQEVIDLFIWAGQSNAQGWQGDAAYYPTDTDNLDSQIRLNYTYIDNTESDGWITMQPQEGRFASGHFGAEVTFSRELKREGYNPAIFKYTKGGSSLYADWGGPGAGGYYDAMVAALDDAISDLENEGHTVHVRGFIWIQGESDATNNTSARSYESNLRNLVNDLRNNVVHNASLPIILGVDEQNPSVVDQPAVLNAQQKLDAEDVNIQYTSMYGLPKADETHLTPAGIITHGQRLFESFALLTSSIRRYSAGNITSAGTVVSTLQCESWGQSFKPSCSGYLSELVFNSASTCSSALTLSIYDGADCNAVLVHSQTVNSLVDGDNSVNLSASVCLDKEHTYYFNINSDYGFVWRVRYNLTNQVAGSLRSSMDGQDGSTCGRSFPDYDLNFSVAVKASYTGLDPVQNSKTAISIYPNPSAGNVYLNLHQHKNISVQVVDVNGNIIYNENKIENGIHVIDLHDVLAGIYILQVRCEGGLVQYHKLIVQ